MTDKIQNNSENSSLTPKQVKAVGFLLTCRTMGEAAEKSGISERTLFAWMKQDAFREALRERENQTLDNATRRLIQGQDAALDALSSLISKGRNESVRRAAAVDWLNIALKFRDLNDIDKRLTELEGMMKNDKK